MSQFKDKVVIITGASGGIGEATALRFVAGGASLVLAGRNKENLTNVSNNIQSKYPSAVNPLLFLGDVTEEDYAKRLIDGTINHFGKLDVLINCAGVLLKFQTIETLDIDIYQKTMDINLRSVIKLMKESIPYLEKTKGCIVNVSSFLGHRSIPNVLAYGISKAGLDQLTKCSALELAPKGIRVNAVNPATVRTEFQRTAGLNEVQYDAYMKNGKTTHPLGRVGEVDDVAAGIVFIASDDASFITGSLLPIDGGRHVAHAK